MQNVNTDTVRFPKGHRPGCSCFGCFYARQQVVTQEQARRMAIRDAAIRDCRMQKAAKVVRQVYRACRSNLNALRHNPFEVMSA